MEFISQTSADDKGYYTTTWKTKLGKIVKIQQNIFNSF